jgi:gluconolactonase
MANRLLILLAGTIGVYFSILRFTNNNALLINEPVQNKFVNTQPDTSGLFAEGGKLNLISKQFTFTEGPAADKQGNIFFTDQPNDKIWIYHTDGTLSVFMDKTGRSNGLAFNSKGNLIACADENNQLWCITPKKKVTVLLKDFRGQFFNGPNDAWVDAKDGIYFTDPLYERPWWEKGRTHIPHEKVYYLPKGKKEPIVVDDTIVKPNGIVGTPDGKHLFVADIGAWKTYKFDIRPDGSLTNRQLFTDKGSDGMTIDEKGNIYLTGDGIIIFNPEGKQIAHIPVPAKWTANVCFGGKDRKKLFITASEAVYTVDMAVKGAD